MIKLADDLKTFEFSKIGEFVLYQQDTLAIVLKSPSPLHNHDEMVYMWAIEEKKSVKAICYIGSTEKTLSKRCKQHEKRFINTLLGKKSSQRIVALLNRGKTVSIYARIPQKVKCFGVIVSAHKTEETALIKRYCSAQPLLNKQGKKFNLHLEDLMSGIFPPF